MATAPSSQADDLTRFISNISINPAAGAGGPKPRAPGPVLSFNPAVRTVSQDLYARYVQFEGREEAYTEPHFSARTDPRADNDFKALIAARWAEYRAERYLRSVGAESAATTPPDDSGVRANTPIQLFLVYSRAARARVELRVYGELLKGVRPAMLEEFEEVLRQSARPDLSRLALP